MADSFSPEARLRHDLAMARRVAIDSGSGREPSMQVVLQVYEALTRERERGRFALPALDPVNEFLQHLAVARGVSKLRRFVYLAKKFGKIERREANALLGTDSWAVFEQLCARAAKLHIDYRALIWSDRAHYFAGPALETASLTWDSKGAMPRAAKSPDLDLGDEHDDEGE